MDPGILSRLRRPALGGLALAWGAAALAAPIPFEGAPDTPYRVPRAAAEITVDGLLDESAWAQALKFDLDYEVRPGENVPPPVRTECLLLYGERHLYFAFRAYDPDPSKIRARFSDRDRAWNDDWVGVVLDTFNDQRRAYELFSNPLGVQIDAINDEVGGRYDDSWNAIWKSAGRITEGGYDVEMAIPFNQIRFQSVAGEQVWGFDAIRSYPRGDRHHIGLFPRDRGNNSYLSQTVKLVGMSGASPGKNLEIIPTLTASRTDERDVLPNGDLEEVDSGADVGVSVRWGITPNLSLNGALNPDFSQVEADAVQLDINEEFALFFPETRPFFLEGADYFNTGLGLVHTRTVADPSSAAKLTGKEGPHTFGIFSAVDETTNMIFPGPEGSDSGSFAENNTTSVARYRYDFGGSSTIGGTVTDRRGGGYYNQVIGADTVYKITSADTINLSIAASRTEYSEEMKSEGAPDGKLDDRALAFNYSHSVRGWWTNVSYQDFGEDYRSDVGFRPQVDYATWVAGGAKVFWGDDESFFDRIGLGGDVDRSEQQNGDLLEEEVETWLNLDGPKQSFTRFGFGRRNRVFEGVEFEQWFGRASFSFQATRNWSLGFGGDMGDAIDFEHTRPADRVSVWTDHQYHLGRHLLIGYFHSYQTLEVAGGQLFRVHVPQARIVQQFTTRAFVRAILQYTDIRRNVELYDDPSIEPETKDFLAQLLFSYKVNASTAVYVGYTDGYVGTDDFSLTQSARTFFFKVGYAWVP